MYSGDTFNSHLLLRYGFTLDFFETFSFVQYLGIEIPPVLLHPYHCFIRERVNQLMGNSPYLLAKQKQWNIYSMKDVQQRLQRLPGPVQNLSKDKERKTILLSGQLIDFALSQLINFPVIVLLFNQHDRKAIARKTLPPNFLILDLYKLLKSMVLSTTAHDWISSILSSRIKTPYMRQHEIFSHPSFLSWFNGHIFHGMKQIEFLTKLIINHPIGVILDHSELVFPGNVLSLLARRYGIPFVNVQFHLTNDASIIPSQATHYAVWGQHMVEWLKKRGIPETAIYPIGSIRLEDNKKYIHKKREDLLKALHLTHNPFILTFTTECYASSVNYSILQWMQYAVEKLPILILIKPHPGDQTSYHSFVSERIRLSPPDFHLQEILHASDLIATISSTTALEGALLNKGIIVLQPYIPYDYDLNYNGYPAILADGNGGAIVYHKGELVEVLRKMIMEKSYLEENRQKGQVLLNHMISRDNKSAKEGLKELIDQIFNGN